MTQTQKQGQADKSGKLCFRKRVLLSIKQHNNEAVKFMLENFKIRHSVETRGATLLHCSATFGNAEITRYLLDKGFHVDAQDLMGRTPLMKAVTGSHCEIVKILLIAGADIFIVNDEGKSVHHEIFAEKPPARCIFHVVLGALHEKKCSNEEKAKRLIDAGCKLYEAVILQDFEIVKCMLDQGSPVNSADPIYGQTALHRVFQLADAKMVKLLLQRGADIEALDIHRNTPLWFLHRNTCHHESANENFEILKFLLDQGILSKFNTPEGMRQLHTILVSGSCEDVRLILQSTADFTVKDYIFKATLLHYCAINVNPGVAAVLKCYIEKFDVNVLDEFTGSPLTYASRFGNVDVMKLLLENGAKVDGFTSKFDCMPLHIIYSNGSTTRRHFYDECAELLFEYNADPQVVGVGYDREQLTIFDAGTNDEISDRFKLAIAKLAILERQGKPISELVRSKIDSHEPFKKYFNDCRKILEKRILDSVTVFKLLTESDTKIVGYLRNEKLVNKLVRISYKNNSYVQVFKSLGNRLIKAFYKIRLQNKAAGFICKIFNGRVDESNLIVEKIIEYFNDETLSCICKI